MKPTIPAAALATHLAVLGKAGSGKTYAIRGVVEYLLDTEQRVCVIDPTGAWYGLRTMADGKKAGYPVVIFGGSHADFPLSAHHGEELAEIIGTSSTPAILDTSQMRTSERVRLFTDFAEGLLRKNRGPLHLIIDEAHLFAPQGRVNDPQSGQMLHAANNLVSLGRVRGLRVTMITQRPAKLHKDSLTQVETLIAMRLIAPQDRKAVEEWIKDNADEKQAREVLSSLATLKTGTGWLWAPELGILERVQFPKITTFDSGQAPKDGDSTGTSGPVLVPIDREAIAGRLKAVAQEAEANDPKKLRARIAELEREQRVLRASPAPTADQLSHAADEAYGRGRTDGFNEGAARGYRQGWEEALNAVTHAIAGLPAKASPTNTTSRPVMNPPAQAEARNRDMRLHGQRIATPHAEVETGMSSRPEARPVTATARQSDHGSIGGGARRRMMIGMAQNPDGVSGRKLAILADVAQGGSTWRGVMAALRKDRHVDDLAPGCYRLTDAGLRALGRYEPLPTGRALRDYWQVKLGSGTRGQIFAALLASGGATVPARDVAAAANVELGGSTWRGHMAYLRGLELVSGSDPLQISRELF